MQAIIDASQAIDTGEWAAVGSVARIRKTASGDSTSVIIEWETSDHRAKRIFNAEYHHFSEQVANVLVVNVTAVVDGISQWEKLIARLLQPTQNRKVGAVILFSQSIAGFPERVQNRWKVIVNTYAHVNVPESLIEGIKSLDEP